MENAHPWLQVLVSLATPPWGLMEQRRLRGSPTGTGQPPGMCHDQAGAQSNDWRWKMIRECQLGAGRSQGCLRLAQITVTLEALLTSA